MATSDAHSKLLWGRAAGLCSNPDCRVDLTCLLNNSSYNVGEMAHIIAKSKNGPRAEPEGSSDAYENLILLCPTCHRKIDKDPNAETNYPVELLREWKKQHESLIRSKGCGETFQTMSSLKKRINFLLSENRLIWERYGPQSDEARSNLGSNLYKMWELRKAKTIIPNNRAIINLIESNVDLLNHDQLYVFLLFKDHAIAFEENHYSRLEKYPLFPNEFTIQFKP